MRFKRWTMLSVISFLVLGIFGCEMPGENKGTAGPSTGGPTTYTGTITTGSGYVPPPPPTTTVETYYEPIYGNIIVDRHNLGFGESIGVRAEVYGGQSPYSFEWNSSEGYFDNRIGNPVTWHAPASDMRQWTDVKVEVKIRDSRGQDFWMPTSVRVEKTGYGGGFNSPPVFDGNPWADRDYIRINDRVRLFANAHDPDGNSIRFEWFCRSGEGRFENQANNPNHSEVDWVATVPSAGGRSFEIVCKIVDDKGAFNECGKMINIESSNMPPNLYSVIISPQYGIAGGTYVSCNAYANDPDSDAASLSYSWEQRPPYMGNSELPYGTFMPNNMGQSVQWQAPIIGRTQAYGAYSVTYMIKVFVRDPMGNTNFREFVCDVLTDPNR